MLVKSIKAASSLIARFLIERLHEAVTGYAADSLQINDLTAVVLKRNQVD